MTKDQKSDFRSKILQFLQKFKKLLIIFLKSVLLLIGIKLCSEHILAAN